MQHLCTAHVLYMLRVHSGVLEFPEFCAFIACIRQGDRTLTGFAAPAAILNQNPVAALAQQAEARRLRVTYVVIEERPATLHNPATHNVMEVQLTGEWHSHSNSSSSGPGTSSGSGDSSISTKRHQVSVCILIGDAPYAYFQVELLLDV
jgi:hypothetical protein